MAISDKIEGTLENWSGKWKERAGGWLLETLSAGVTKFAEDMEPGAIEASRAGLEKLRDNPNTPEELRQFYDKALKPGNPIAVIGGVITLLLQSLGTLLGGSQPLANIFRYEQERLLGTFRWDPLSVITGWRRDPGSYEVFFEDLKEQGWSPERIDMLKVITLHYPSPQDLIAFMAHEVFEDPLAARYGLDAEIGDVLKHKDVFEKAGMTEEQIGQYWRNHWEHASFNQVVEMLHRGVLTESSAPLPTTPEGWVTRDAEGSELMKDWFKLVEMSTFWRDKLEAISWNVPTRVDVRRWWDMRTISENELRNIYHRQGYHGTDLDNYVKWTKVYTEFPSLMARWSNGWISTEDIRTRLKELDIEADRIEELIQEKIKPETPARTAADKAITVTDIYKGVKQDRITRDQAIELLMELGYDEDEADYKLAVNIPVDVTDKVQEDRFLTKSDVIAGLKTEVISEDEAIAKLQEIRYSTADSQFLINIFKASINPPAEPRQKEASKADVIKAVKKGLLTQEEAYLMLIDIGFTSDASIFILDVNAEESPFSPVDFGEFREITGKYRKVVTGEGPKMPEEIKAAAAEVVRLTKDVESLTQAIKEENSKLTGDEILPDTATRKLKRLQVARNRAQAELSQAQTEYNIKVAAWKHGD